MSFKKKDFDIIVVGSGLSSLSFIESYLEKHEKINVISPNFKNNFFEEKYLNSHIDKYLPPQMNNKINEVKKYFFYNKINIEKNAKVFGSLQFGGLSNYWGLQIDNNIDADIDHLSKNTKKKINESFFKIFSRYNLLGEVNAKKKKYKNDYKLSSFFKKLFEKKSNDFNITKPVLAYSKRKTQNESINLELINETKVKFTAKNYYESYLKNKNIIFHNYSVNKIYKKKNKIFIDCENSNGKEIFSTKKLVLGCGTIATTRLVLDFLKFNEEVKIKHHPRLFSLLFSKLEYKTSMEFMPSTVNIRNKKNLDYYVMDFRPGNKLIIDSIVDFKKYLFPFKFILNYLKKYMIFSNIFLHSKYSNLFMKLEKNSNIRIFSKKNKIKPIFKNIHDKVFKYLKNEKLIYPISYTFFPGFGADFHYFGTIPITKKNKKLSVNDKCQLKMYKNIYIVDGSVLDFKTNKYPLGLIMANARRIGKEIR